MRARRIGVWASQAQWHKPPSRLVPRVPNIARVQSGDGVSLERAGLGQVRAFAEHGPGPRRVNRFPVHFEPFANLLDNAALLAVNGAVGLALNIQQKRAVLGHRINHPVNYIARRQVTAVFARPVV